MGFQLTLFFLQDASDLTKTTVSSHNRLQFDQDYLIFEQIVDFGDHKQTIKTNPIPPQMFVRMYEDEGMYQTRQDRYGADLKFVYARDFKKIVSNATSSKNKAILTFIGALPEHTPVILFWS